MFLAGRTALVVIAALVAVKPLMACCLNGDVVGESRVTTSPAPHCHQDLGGSEHRKSPSCCDCDTAAMSSTDRLMSVVPPGVDQLVLVSIERQIVPRVEQRVLPFETGPPDAQPGSLKTPVTLKQRLLI